MSTFTNLIIFTYPTLVLFFHILSFFCYCIGSTIVQSLIVVSKVHHNIVSQFCEINIFILCSPTQAGSPLALLLRKL